MDNYFVLDSEQGKINVSIGVLADIVGAACAEIDGVCGMATVEGSQGKGVIFAKGDNQGLEINVHIMIRLGHQLALVAGAVQAAVRDAVISAAGVEPVAVNVYVAGVTHK